MPIQSEKIVLAKMYENKFYNKNYYILIIILYFI